jgi:hypothetical protein
MTGPAADDVHGLAEDIARCDDGRVILQPLPHSRQGTVVERVAR